MNNNESISKRERQIDAKASEWVARKFRGFSAAEQDEFFEWLGSDPAHSEAYVRYQDLWERMDTLAEWAPEHSEQPHRDLLRDRQVVYRWVWLGGIAATLALSSLLWVPKIVEQPQPTPQNYVANAYNSHELEDGTVVDMNSGAAMVVDFTESERRVELVASEALFNVAKDPDRPFIVSAKGVEVQAIGTVFNVRVSEGEVEVLVTEGKVRIGASPSTFATSEVSEPFIESLVAGQSSVVYLDGGEAPPVLEEPSEDQIFEKLAWKYKLEFDSTPLSAAVEEINRRSDVQLEIADESIGALPIVATLRIDNIDHCVELLELTLGIESEYLSDSRVLLKKGGKSL